jgi:RNA polymerase sigma-70 factor (ECF subfamily)
MADEHHGLQRVLEENREALLRYLRAHGAGDAADDLLQELWIRIAAAPAGPIASPRSYLFRAATNLMIDYRRAETQARRRDDEWSGLADRLSTSVEPGPGPERALDAQRRLAAVRKGLETLPRRALAIFRAHRIEGRSQRDVAAAFGVSTSTVESDLRLAYGLLDDIRRRLDEE